MVGSGLGAGQSDGAEVDVGAEFEDVDPEPFAGGRAGERLARQVAFPRDVQRLRPVRGHDQHVVEVGP